MPSGSCGAGRAVASRMPHKIWTKSTEQNKAHAQACAGSWHLVFDHDFNFPPFLIFGLSVCALTKRRTFVGGLVVLEPTLNVCTSRAGLLPLACSCAPAVNVNFNLQLQLQLRCIPRPVRTS